MADTGAKGVFPSLTAAVQTHEALVCKGGGYGGFRMTESECEYRGQGRAKGYLRTFVLRRHEDVSGVSGTGIVAWGVEFPDGVVAIRWASEWPTSVVFHDKGLEAVLAVHGHDGRTEIEWASSWPRGSLSRDEPWGPNGQCSRCGHDDLPVRGTVNPLCWQCADDLGREGSDA